MKQGVFKYFFVLGFIILLIITYVIFYDKNDIKDQVKDQTSTKSTLITDLRLGIAEFDTMNPLISNNRNVKEISRLIFDSLITVGNNYELQFNLAKGIARENDTTYILTLRENVKWQDGTAFTAQDVKFTFDAINDTLKSSGINSSYSTNLKHVDGLEIIDNYTIKIFLSEPEEFFEYNLTMPILSKNYFEGEDLANTEKNNWIIGTGMFKISEISDGIIKLSQNENYWNTDRNPLLTEIDINLYENIGQMYAAFKSGYIDIMDVTVPDVENFIGSLGYTKIEIPQRNVVFLAFNCQHELFTDSRTRKAINLYLDKNNILANIGSGYMISNFLIPQNSWVYDSRLDISGSSEEADKLLTDAGWSYLNNKWVNQSGKVLEFSITVDSTKQDRVVAANVIATQLANHGIEVTVKEESNASFEKDFNNKNYVAMIARITNWI